MAIPTAIDTGLIYLQFIRMFCCADYVPVVGQQIMPVLPRGNTRQKHQQQQCAEYSPYGLVGSHQEMQRGRNLGKLMKGAIFKITR